MSPLEALVRSLVRSHGALLGGHSQDRADLPRGENTRRRAPGRRRSGGSRALASLTLLLQTSCGGPTVDTSSTEGSTVTGGSSSSSTAVSSGAESSTTNNPTTDASTTDASTTDGSTTDGSAGGRDYELVQSVDLGAYRRPDAQLIGSQLLVSMFSFATGRFILAEVSGALDLSELGPLKHRDAEFPTDIRIASDGASLWYGVESIEQPPLPECGRNHLSAGKYSVDSGELSPDYWTADITTGCPSMPAFIEAVAKGMATVPEDAKAVDDPTPLFWNDAYYLLVRDWSGPTEHVFEMDASMTVVESFTLDLSGELGNGESISQNALVVLDGSVHLIAGVSDGPPFPGWTSSIKAFPLSADLKSAAGAPTTLISAPDGYYTRVTAARFEHGRLFFNYLERSTGGGEDLGSIAIFSVGEDASFTLQENVLFQAESAADNHSSFDIVDDKLVVFYQTPNGTVAAKIFAPTN